MSWNGERGSLSNHRHGRLDQFLSREMHLLTSDGVLMCSLFFNPVPETCIMCFEMCACFSFCYIFYIFASCFSSLMGASFIGEDATPSCASECGLTQTHTQQWGHREVKGLCGCLWKGGGDPVSLCCCGWWAQIMEGEQTTPAAASKATIWARSRSALHLHLNEELDHSSAFRGDGTLWSYGGRHLGDKRKSSMFAVFDSCSAVFSPSRLVCFSWWW